MEEGLRKGSGEDWLQGCLEEGHSGQRAECAEAQKPRVYFAECSSVRQRIGHEGEEL